MLLAKGGRSLAEEDRMLLLEAWFGWFDTAWMSWLVLDFGEGDVAAMDGGTGYPPPKP